MQATNRQLSVRAAGFTLIELVAVLAILALTTALALPAVSALSRHSRARSAAGEVANLMNRRLALARAGAGPCEIAVSGASALAVTIPAELDADAAADSANTVLGRSQLSSSSAAKPAQPASEDPGALETLDLGGVSVEGFYVKALSTGEARHRLAVTSEGTSDDALVVLSEGGVKAYVSVRGLTGRARAHDRLLPFLAEYFEVPDNAQSPRE